MTVASCGHISVRPPLWGVSLRVATYTYGLIKKTQDFGVCLPLENQIRAVDICGSTSGREGDKFKKVGFTPMQSTLIKSPLIKECPVGMECKLTSDIELGDHHWMVGEVVALHVDEEMILNRRSLDLSKCKLVYSVFLQYLRMGEKLADWSESRERASPQKG